MKMYVFEQLDQVSDNYHSGGGLTVVARDKDHLNELIAEVGNIEIAEEEWSEVSIYELKNEEEPKVFVFLDAGCC